MEDSYANYTIDAGALLDAIEFLGDASDVISIGAGILMFFPVVGGFFAGVELACGIVGPACTFISTGADLQEGEELDWNNILNEIVLLLLDGTSRGIVKTGALTKEEEKDVKLLFEEIKLPLKIAKLNSDSNDSESKKKVSPKKSNASPHELYERLKEFNSPLNSYYKELIPEYKETLNEYMETSAKVFGKKKHSTKNSEK